MENKTIKAAAYIIAAILAVVVGIRIIDAITYFSNPEIPIGKSICILIEIITAFWGLFYVFVGCNKKQGSKYYTLFIVFMAINIFCAIFDEGVRSELYNIIIVMLAFASLCVLAFSTDLGRTKSFFIGAFNSILMIIWFILSSNNLDGKQKTEVQHILLFNFILSLVLLIMIFAKYQDKMLRGHK